MGKLTLKKIQSSSEDEIFKLLGEELEKRITTITGSSEFLFEIQKLPVGLRAMAATYDLDVSLTLDDLGWHFGNWHNKAFAQETAHGLEVLGVNELAMIFREAYQIALPYWSELGSKNWTDWYGDSLLEKELDHLNKKAWQFLEKHEHGIFHYWVDYARKHPEDVGVTSS